MSRPIHIVMTPTRNEAWVIRAFLECNGLWADYIIIADQMSTDGTREIIAEYQERWNTVLTTPSTVHRTQYTVHNMHQCQLIMIDNTNPEFNEAERQSMLVAEEIRCYGDWMRMRYYRQTGKRQRMGSIFSIPLRAMCSGSSGHN